MKTNPLVGWIFVIPAFFLVIVFLIYPTFRTVQLSFDTGENFTTSKFIGLDNYVELFTQDHLFLDLSEGQPRGAMVNTLLWLFVYTPGTVGLGLLFAVLANTVRYEVIIKTIIFVPMGISYTATGIIWRFVYSNDPNTGVINAILTALIPGFSPVAWIGRQDLVNLALIVTAIWTSTGFSMVVFSAALKSLPGEVLEAAFVDGANSWRRFWSVIVPMLSPTTIVLTTTAVIYVLKAFDLVYIMAHDNTAARIIGFSMYTETFDSVRPGYGSAIAVVMLILVLPFVLYNIRRFQAER
jgi:alpha-glucoside transport system permease protein